MPLDHYGPERVLEDRDHVLEQAAQVPLHQVPQRGLPVRLAVRVDAVKTQVDEAVTGKELLRLDGVGLAPRQGWQQQQETDDCEGTPHELFLC